MGACNCTLSLLTRGPQQRETDTITVTVTWRTLKRMQPPSQGGDQGTKGLIAVLSPRAESTKRPPNSTFDGNHGENIIKYRGLASWRDWPDLRRDQRSVVAAKNNVNKSKRKREKKGRGDILLKTILKSTVIYFIFYVKKTHIGRRQASSR